MKKLWILGLLGMAARGGAAFGQGVVYLDNELVGFGPAVTYGTSDIPANGVSGVSGNAGWGLEIGWTAGFYYAPGDITGFVGSDGTANMTGLPTTQNPNFILATGSGGTSPFVFAPGLYTGYQIFHTSVPVGGIITVELIAYYGSSYAPAAYRGHSAPFTTTTYDPNVISIPAMENYQAFSVFAVPEPSALSFLGMSGAALLFFRRRSA